MSTGVDCECKGTMQREGRCRDLSGLQLMIADNRQLYNLITKNNN